MTAVITLALGVAACAAAVAIDRALVYDAGRIAGLEDVYALRFVGAANGRSAASPLTFDRVRELQRRAQPTGDRPVFRQLTGVRDVGLAVRTRGRSEQLAVEVVGGQYADVFRLHPQAGRWPAAEDDDPGASPSVVVSDRLWREWFGADATIVDRASLEVTARLPNGQRTQTFRILGVAPRGYRGLHEQVAIDAWITSRAFESIASDAGAEASWVESAYVRATAGTDPARLTDVLAAALGPIAQPRSPAHEDPLPLRVDVVPATKALASQASATSIGILSLAALVLFAACANLANMLYARGAARASEVAVRLSLGASRARIFRLFVIESSVIATAAAAVGLGIALGALRIYASAFPTLVSRTTRRLPIDLTLDARFFVTALATGLAGALIVGVATARRATRVPPNRALIASASIPMALAGRLVRRALVAVEVTAAVLLMIVTGVYAETYRGTFDKHVEFDTSQIAVARVDLSELHDTESRGRAFYANALDAARKLPGVEQAALADGVPGASGGGWLPGLTTVTAESEGTHVPGAGVRRIGGHYASVTPSLFDTLGLRITRGRPLRTNDGDGAPLVAVVTETVATTLWPGQDPIGKRLATTAGGWMTVVGVSTDPARSVDASAQNSPGSYVFVPFDQRYRSSMVVLVRSRTPAAAVEPLRQTLRTLDEDVVIQDSGTFDVTMLEWVGPLRAAASLMGTLGALALGIAGVGVYGVMSFLVSARMREFGVRLALGATPRRLQAMVLDQTLTMLLVGLLPGVLIASLGASAIWRWLPAIKPTTITPWIVVPIAILGLGLLAALAPARRAARVDPNVALREL
jgi:predicted permease